MRDLLAHRVVRRGDHVRGLAVPEQVVLRVRHRLALEGLDDLRADLGARMVERGQAALRSARRECPVVVAQRERAVRRSPSLGAAGTASRSSSDRGRRAGDADGDGCSIAGTADIELAERSTRRLSPHRGRPERP